MDDPSLAENVLSSDTGDLSWLTQDHPQLHKPTEEAPFVLKEDDLRPWTRNIFGAAACALVWLSRCARGDLSHSVVIFTRSVAKPGKRAETTT